MCGNVTSVCVMACDFTETIDTCPRFGHVLEFHTEHGFAVNTASGMQVRGGVHTGETGGVVGGKAPGTWLVLLAGCWQAVGGERLSATTESRHT